MSSVQPKFGYLAINVASHGTNAISDNLARVLAGDQLKTVAGIGPQRSGDIFINRQALQADTQTHERVQTLEAIVSEFLARLQSIQKDKRENLTLLNMGINTPSLPRNEEKQAELVELYRKDDDLAGQRSALYQSYGQEIATLLSGIFADLKTSGKIPDNPALNREFDRLVALAQAGELKYHRYPARPEDGIKLSSNYRFSKRQTAADFIPSA